MSSISVAYLLIQPFALDFYPSSLNTLLVNKVFSRGPRFALQFNETTEDLTSCFVILSEIRHYLATLKNELLQKQHNFGAENKLEEEAVTLIMDENCSQKSSEAVNLI